MYRQQFPDYPGEHYRPDADSANRVNYHRSETFGERIKRGWVQLTIGLVLIAASFGLLMYNEGRAVQTSKSLNEGLNLVRILQNTEIPFSENDNKLIHLTGPVKTSKVLYDDEYHIAINAVKLKRVVEIYQWIEHETTRENRDGENVRTESTYHYTQEWKTDIIASDDFYSRAGHHNPKNIPIESKLYQADDVQIGAFYISADLCDKFKTYKTIKLSGIHARVEAVIFKDYFYHGNDPVYPQIGDVRVSFEYTGFSGKGGEHYGDAQIVSVIAKQEDTRLTIYQTEAGDDILFLYEGKYSAEKIFGNEIMSNALLTWGIRLGGWLVMFIGFGCLTSIITLMVDKIPILRELIMVGVHTLNFTLSASFSIFTIALGWLFYRPWLSFILIVLALVPYAINIYRSRSRRPPFSSSRSYED